MSRTASWMIFASLELAGPARADVSEPTADPQPPAPLPQLSTLPPSMTEPLQDPANTITSSYRSMTMTVDAISIAALLGSFATQGKAGADNGVSVSLFAIGGLGAVYGVPIIHGVRGHWARGVASWMIRESTMGVGMLVAVSTAPCTREQWFCGLDRISPGMAGGLVVASVIDAVFLTDEKQQRAPTGTAWTPLLAPGRGGGTIGVAATF